MPSEPVRFYPDAYEPGDWDIDVQIAFVRRDGRRWLYPDLRLPAGACGTWEIKLTNRAQSLMPGACVSILRFNCQFAYTFQTTHPHRRDYCTIENTGSARLRLIIAKDQLHLATIIVEDGVWAVGDTITLRLGDRRRGSVGSEVFWAVTEGTLLVAVSPQPGHKFQGVAGNPFTFQVVAAQAARLRVLGPTVAAVGVPFAVHVSVYDINGNPAVDFAGTVRLACDEGAVEVLGEASAPAPAPAPAPVPAPASAQFPSPALVGLPSEITFTLDDAGVKVLSEVRAVREGVFRLRAVSPELGAVGDGQFSNPIVVQEKPHHYIYWGDVHAHGWGDSTMYLMHRRTEKLDPLSRHRQGRLYGRFDFAFPGAMSMPQLQDGSGAGNVGARSAGDAGAGVVSTGDSHPGEIWQAYQEACRLLDAPGEYVPFLSYEAHPPSGGDRQVMFRHWENEPLPPPMRAPMEELDKHYAGRDDVILQVHIGGAPPEWDAYRPAGLRMVEVVSGFGAAEWLLQQALALGYHPAVCGASDLHLGLMGGPRAVEPFRGRFGQKYPMCQRDAAYGQGPVTAVIAPKLEREALWQAMRQRLTYATTGARIFLAVTANGYPMGSVIPPEKMGEAVEVRIECHGTAEVDRIDLIVGRYQVRSWQPHSLDCSLTALLRAAEIPGNWLYVRVHQRDGEYAWSTPIWLALDIDNAKVNDKIKAPFPLWNEPDPLFGFGLSAAKGTTNGKGAAAATSASDAVTAASDAATATTATTAATAAEAYLPAVRAYLELEENPRLFADITPVAIERLSAGTCALFYCYYGEERLPMSIRWFFEFEIPRIRFDWGERDFGAREEDLFGPYLKAKYSGA
ncbi:MAG TPA: DUF3604 domain-containing protein [Firmicutes bacterium]|nr:DUF3604 domain-containing protein [Bacillota bacterium]